MVVMKEGQTVRLNEQIQKKQLPSQDGVLHCFNPLLTAGQTQQQKDHKPPIHYSNMHADNVDMIFQQIKILSLFRLLPFEELAYR